MMKSCDVGKDKSFIRRHQLFWGVMLLGLSLGNVAVEFFGAPVWVKKVGAGVTILAFLYLAVLYVREVLRKSKEDKNEKVQ